jgi:hypothetical protein
MITVLPADLAIARANIADTFLTEVEERIVSANNYGITSANIVFPLAFAESDRTTVVEILNNLSFTATQEPLQNNIENYPQFYLLSVVW